MTMTSSNGARLIYVNAASGALGLYFFGWIFKATTVPHKPPRPQWYPTRWGLFYRTRLTPRSLVQLDRSLAGIDNLSDGRRSVTVGVRTCP